MLLFTVPVLNCDKFMLSRSHGITSHAVPVPAVTAVINLVPTTVPALFPQ